MYVGYRLGQWLASTLPTESAFRLAERLADVQWRRSAKDREAVHNNLSVLLDAPPPVGAPIVREVFRNFGRYLVEFLTMHRVHQPEVSLEGYEHLTKTLHPRRGTIVLTGHIGNWELAGVVIRRTGIPLTAVALPHQDPRTDQLFNWQRRRCGLNVIPLGADATRRALQDLRQGHCLGLVGDREFSTHGLTTPLCQRQVVLPRGPALLSLRGQAPVVPLFLIREGMWRFRLYVEPPIWPAASRPNEGSVQMLTRAYAAVFERYLRRFPDQWLMFQPMWCDGSRWAVGTAS